MTIRAIYENGVFKPVDPVVLPEHTSVDIPLPESKSDERRNQEQIFGLLRKSYASGATDVAERHNEHQP